MNKILTTFVVMFLFAASLAAQEAPDGYVLVDGGTFRMGSTSGESDEEPVHSVTVSGFYISDHEVTQGEWRTVMGRTVREQRDMANPEWFLVGTGDDYPIYYVSWYDALAYCNRLSASEGLTAVYYTDSGLSAKFSPSGSVPQSGSVYADWSANGYRLPTEAEWEFAARGGKLSRGYTYSGSDTVGDVGWYIGNSRGKTHPVGGKQPNELGLYDMSGNVWEWCWDWYGSSYYGSSPSRDPRGPSSGSYRVERGGSWYYNDAHFLRSANRSRSWPDDRYDDIGFRPVRTR